MSDLTPAAATPAPTAPPAPTVLPMVEPHSHSGVSSPEAAKMAQ